MLHYKDLTEEQKAEICNGCGGKGGLINPPEFLFHASCDHHDFLYWRGGTEDDRKRADKEFYKWMKIDCSTQSKSNFQYYKYSTLAYIYYKFVRLFGKKFFNYGKQKTLEDLK